ncbi:BppU family phage baseplate upper protein [Bacillus thuringiensis]|uniref:BppU family phage baseplate upper protein n=1 Tax=Bacillus thuringiensis serovar andalousiensis TaxID=257985 RepID=A0A6H0TPY3_BACTU|nr:BppU family phage baseplate upper protein [Bacillus thuringiensis serovar andalousiensis]
MTFKTYEINVDLVNETSTPATVRFSQNDQNSAKLLINIMNKGGELDLSQATSVRMSFKKSDGTRVFQDDCQPVNVLKGKYQIVLKTQTLAAIGNVYAQIHITENNRVIDTQQFGFVVKESLSSDDAIESTNEFGVIQKVIEAGEKLEGKDIDGIIAAGAKADTAINQIEILSKDLSKQDIKTQMLQHGPNVVNATLASPLNVEVQGRTLANLLGRTTLDPSKYYLFIPNKGTTKIPV